MSKREDVLLVMLAPPVSEAEVEAAMAEGQVPARAIFEKATESFQGPVTLYFQRNTKHPMEDSAYEAAAITALRIEDNALLANLTLEDNPFGQELKRMIDDGETLWADCTTAVRFEGLSWTAVLAEVQLAMDDETFDTVLSQVPPKEEVDD